MTDDSSVVSATLLSIGDTRARDDGVVRVHRLRSDRKGELALFALEVKHEFTLRHEDGCLKARWAPQKLTSLFNFDFDFPPGFDTEKCQRVLEAMHTLADSIERRANR